MDDPSSSPPPVVFVIDDDPAVRRLIAHLLKQQGIDVQLFESAPSFLLRYQHGEGSCIVVNVDMPAMSGIELVKTLQHDQYAPPIIVITAEDTVAQCRLALRNGAWDFVPKPLDHAKLTARVQRAIEINHQRQVVKQDTLAFARRIDQLTDRERFVMERLASGQKVKQIAKALGIGFQTVSKHGIRAFQKLRVDNEVELALKLKQVESLDNVVKSSG
ncbi:MAG: response regulator [Planctomycetaceae bacterium]|nr:response regulator [Planctomycetaceae bacterium]